MIAHLNRELLDNIDIIFYIPNSPVRTICSRYIWDPTSTLSFPNQSINYLTGAILKRCVHLDSLVATGLGSMSRLNFVPACHYQWPLYTLRWGTIGQLPPEGRGESGGPGAAEFEERNLDIHIWDIVGGQNLDLACPVPLFLAMCSSLWFQNEQCIVLITQIFSSNSGFFKLNNVKYRLEDGILHKESVRRICIFNT